jgi:hypothetical protein
MGQGAAKKLRAKDRASLGAPVGPRAKRLPRGGALAALAAAASLPAWGAPASAQVTLADPPANVARTAAMDLACQAGPGPSCQQAVVEAIDQARAAEGVRPLVLPAGFASLTVPEQLLVLADLERVDRGLPGFSGLSSALDALAEAGAAANTDPVGPAGSDWGSNWAGGEASALLADYDWMYDDGTGSPNMDCTASNPSGCWDHRNNILGNYGPYPSMGAAETTVDGVTSMTEVFSSAPAGPLDFTLPPLSSTYLRQQGPPSSLGTQTSETTVGLLQMESNGTVVSFGGTALSSPGPASHLGGPVVGVEAVPGGRGYWEVAASGAVWSFGDAKFYGSVATLHLHEPVVGMAPALGGKGYWLATAKGGVYSFGDAKFFGTPRGHAGNSVVGIVPSPGGQGYWLVTSHGAVYSFGSAHFYGPRRRLSLSAPIVAMAPTHDGHGYWLVSRQGQVYAFGNATHFAQVQVHGTVVGIAVPPAGEGYWLALRDGTVLSFGGAALLASHERPAPVVGVAAV